ncbi:dihydrofolate synthase, partial [bacterium]|nr:dihydrofolate synthase [candidate division CSSED10-310 bacterium]
VRAYCQRAGLSVDRGAVADAMATVRWPGRLQTVSRDGPTLILDGAHNPAAGRALAAALTELFPNRRLIGVIGCSADKDYPGVLANLLPVLDGAVFTRFSSPRAAAPEKLAALAPPTMDARLADNAATALATADEMAGDGGIVIATGSLFLVGDLLAVHSA